MLLMGCAVSIAWNALSHDCDAVMVSRRCLRLGATAYVRFDGIIIFSHCAVGDGDSGRGDGSSGWQQRQPTPGMPCCALLACCDGGVRRARGRMPLGRAGGVAVGGRLASWAIRSSQCAHDRMCMWWVWRVRMINER